MSLPPPLTTEQKLDMSLDDIIAYETCRAAAARKDAQLADPAFPLADPAVSLMGAPLAGPAVSMDASLADSAVFMMGAPLAAPAVFMVDGPLAAPVVFKKDAPLRRLADPAAFKKDAPQAAPAQGYPLGRRSTTSPLPPLTFEQKLSMSLNDIILYDVRRISAVHDEDPAPAIAELVRLGEEAMAVQAQARSPAGRPEALAGRLHERPAHRK